ncbi:RNA polymerase sigma factor [Acrocarpospora macrocephala]|uniref:RNA polymerase subunit sigma-24 n=1 Tax=Acrocarpospora macrocephala TaxID=150177 RepID=A0A5M3WDY3_9ACTN|nr:DUF6596 domain-containing protein [Acrocarpospora macrocephala]GES07277.1 RNA polymerase subunit sigma-24 [Acrocarpospora macrocephala]
MTPARMGGAERAYQEHWARLLALLTAELRDLDLAEESLQDAFAVAVDRWDRDGEPRNPAAWLLVTARRKAVDRLRRGAVAARRLPLLVVDDGPSSGSDIPDDRLRMAFTCCHPALAMPGRVALTLRYVGGLTTRQIARLFLVTETTMAARITRAKKKIAQAGIPYRVPSGAELPARLDGVLAVIYLIFTEAYAPAGGGRLVRDELAAEAIGLGHTLRELIPGDPEVAGLLALMTLHHARRDARTGPRGELVRLPDQDRSLWHHDEIETGLGLIHKSGARPGPYLTQAAIAAEHASAVRAEDTDWRSITLLYGELERLTGSAVVRLNRAVALAEAEGPAAGLALLDDLDAALPYHHLLPATRAELLRRLGRAEDALTQYGRALALVGNDAERAFLLSRRDELLEVPRTGK